MEREGEYPKQIESLPRKPLSFSFLRQLREEKEKIRKISVRRYTSIEAIDGEDQEILELSSGFIPTDVEGFMIDKGEVIFMFEFSKDCWWITAKIQREEVAGQLLSKIIKPYVGLWQIAEMMHSCNGPGSCS